MVEMSIASFEGVENDGDLQHAWKGNPSCKQDHHVPCLDGRVWDTWNRRPMVKQRSLPNPTPNSRQSIDHSPTELIKRPTKSQIALLESVPVFRSPCYTPRTASRPGTSFTVWKAYRWQIIVARLERIELNQIDVCLSYATPRNDC